MKNPLIWFEIRTTKFIKAIEFYEALLNTQMEIKHLYLQRVALFDKEESGLNGCIIEHDCAGNGNGIALFFKVNDMHRSLEQVKLKGGKIKTLPALVKQRDQNGKEIIGRNKFDDDTGYLAEAEDIDGNSFFLYANS